MAAPTSIVSAAAALGAAPPPRAAAPTRLRDPKVSTDEICRVLVGQAFSQVVSVLMRDRTYANLKLADLEWLVLPAVARGQFRLSEPRVRTKAKSGVFKGVAIPAATVLWANVSEDADAMLSDRLLRNFRLEPHEWSGGERTWILAAAGERRELHCLLQDLARTRLDPATTKVRRPLPRGRFEVTRLCDWTGAVQSSIAS